MHRICINQAPNCEGIRLSKWAIVRNTYDMLSTTTKATFEQWLPPAICSTTMMPMRGYLDYKLGDGTRVYCEFIFLSMDRPDDTAKLLSLEVTGIFLNEAKELPFAVLSAARGRAGRYPAQVDGYKDVYDKDGNLIYDAPKQRNDDGSPKLDNNGNIMYTPCTRKCVIMDTNPPDDDHWWYQLAEEGKLRVDKEINAVSETAKIFDFFRGPAPLRS